MKNRDRRVWNKVKAAYLEGITVGKDREMAFMYANNCVLMKMALPMKIRDRVRTRLARFADSAHALK